MNMKEKGKAFIEHHGVKGMRWGVRRSPAQLGNKAKSEDSDKKSSDKHGVTTDTKHRGGSDSMSDAQLKKFNERMNMEQQYSRLTAKPPGFMGAAKKFVGDIALNVAKQQITNLANEQASKQVKGLMGARKGKIPKLPDHLKPPKLSVPPLTPRLG